MHLQSAADRHPDVHLGEGFARQKPPERVGARHERDAQQVLEHEAPPVRRRRAQRAGCGTRTAVCAERYDADAQVADERLEFEAFRRRDICLHLAIVNVHRSRTLWAGRALASRGDAASRR